MMESGAKRAETVILLCDTLSHKEYTTSHKNFVVLAKKEYTTSHMVTQRVYNVSHIFCACITLFWFLKAIPIHFCIFRAFGRKKSGWKIVFSWLENVFVKCQLLCPVRDNYLVRFFSSI